MDQQDWLMLKTLHETGSLTKAAESLFISQPALTYRLHGIEREFNIKIFHRSSKGIRLTDPGEHLVHYAERMLSELQDLRQSLSKKENRLDGTISLGVSTIFAKMKLAPLLKEYKRLYPHVKVSLKTGPSVSLLPALLAKDSIDLAILRHDHFAWQDEQYILWEEPWYLVSSEPINFKLLPAIPWILYETSTRTKTYELFQSWWRENLTVSPPEPVWVNTIEAALQMVSCGLGWCIVPRIFLNKNQHLYTTPLYLNNHMLLHKTLMAYKHKQLTNPAVCAFSELVKKAFPHGHTPIK